MPAQDQSTMIVVATIVSALIASLSKIIESVAPIVLAKYKKRNGNKSDRLATDMLKTAETRKLMQRLIDTNSSTDRVVLWELSNGDSVFTSTHLWKLRFYDEVSRGSIIPIKSMFLNQLVNLIHYSEVIKDLQSKHVVFIEDVNELENQVLRDTLTGSGVRSVYMTLITDMYDNPIGLLSIESIHDYAKIDKPHIEKIEQLTAMLSTKL